MSEQTGKLLAQVGFLLILFAGVWLVAAEVPAFRMEATRIIVAGTALALGGALLLVATRWGHFGYCASGWMRDTRAWLTGAPYLACVGDVLPELPEAH